MVTHAAAGAVGNAFTDDLRTTERDSERAGLRSEGDLSELVSDDRFRDGFRSWWFFLVDMASFFSDGSGFSFEKRDGKSPETGELGSACHAMVTTNSATLSLSGTGTTRRSHQRTIPRLRANSPTYRAEEPRTPDQERRATNEPKK